MLRTLIFFLITALCLCAGDISGKWSGQWETSPDGGPGPHYMVLKQEGGTVTGTAGPTENQQMAITNGTVTGDTLKFDISIPNGPTLKFEFKVTGDAMDGTAVLEMNGQKQQMKLSAKRIKN